MAISKFALERFKRHKKEIIFVTITATIASLLAAVVPYLYGKLFDLSLVPATPINMIIVLIISWFSISIIRDFLSYKTSLEGSIIGYKMSIETEAEAFGHWLSLPIAFHKKKRIGEVLNKISRACSQIENLSDDIFHFLPQVIVLVFAIIAMALIEWRLCLILVFFLAVYVFITAIKIKPILKNTKAMHKIWDKSYGNVYDKLMNVFLVKSFSKEKEESGYIKDQLVEKTHMPFRRMRGSWENLDFMQKIVFSSSFVIVLGLAILFLRKGMISPGEFIMFFGYISLSYTPFWRLGSMFRRFKEAGVALSRLKRLHDIAPEISEHGNKIIRDVKGSIEFRNVSFSYTKERPILRHIDFDAKSGETIALVGESGVGKTTLVELIMGYYKPQFGRILLDGINTNELSLEWLRQKIAFVPQELTLFDNTILNNLRYANPKATKNEIIEACKLAFAHDFIEKLPKKYNTIVGEHGVKLSVGQKQRIAIAMAFLKNPSILILDEPTSALDPQAERLIQASLKRLIKGRTTFIIAHRLSTVKQCDKIIVLHNGQIAEIGSHNELIKKKGIYYNFYSMQTGLA